MVTKTGIVITTFYNRNKNTFVAIPPDTALALSGILRTAIYLIIYPNRAFYEFHKPDMAACYLCGNNPMMKYTLCAIFL